MANSKIRKSAKGEDCTLRLGQCSIPETVVLAHIGRIRGMGIKCTDSFAVFACSTCHDIIDGRQKSQLTKTELKAEMLRALEESQLRMIEMGVLVES